MITFFVAENNNNSWNEIISNFKIAWWDLIEWFERSFWTSEEYIILFLIIIGLIFSLIFLKSCYFCWKSGKEFRVGQMKFYVIFFAIIGSAGVGLIWFIAGFINQAYLLKMEEKQELSETKIS